MESKNQKKCVETIQKGFTLGHMEAENRFGPANIGRLDGNHIVFTAGLFDDTGYRPLCNASRQFLDSVMRMDEDDCTENVQRNRIKVDVLKASSIPKDGVLALCAIGGHVFSSALNEKSYNEGARRFKGAKELADALSEMFSIPSKWSYKNLCGKNDNNSSRGKYVSPFDNEVVGYFPCGNNKFPGRPENPLIGISWKYGSSKNIKETPLIMLSEMMNKETNLPVQCKLSLALKYAKGNKVYRIRTGNRYGVCLYAMTTTLIDEMNELHKLGKLVKQHLSFRLKELACTNPMFFLVKEEYSPEYMNESKRYYRCEHCGELISEEDSVFRNRHRLCGYCASVIPVYKCMDCGKKFVIPLDEPFASISLAKETGDAVNPICQSCYMKNGIVAVFRNDEEFMGYADKSEGILNLAEERMFIPSSNLDFARGFPRREISDFSTVRRKIDAMRWYHPDDSIESISSCECAFCGRRTIDGKGQLVYLSTCDEEMESIGAKHPYGQKICIECAAKLGLKRCDRCHEYFLPEHIHDNKYSRALGNHLCDDCLSSAKGFTARSFGQNGFVFNHFWRPNDSTFHSCRSDAKDGKNKLYLGFELESGGLPSESAADGVANHLAKTFSNYLNIFYMKYDGSIPKHGFELVSQPITLAKHIELGETVWEPAIAYMKSKGMTFPELCGLHVHVSRNFLSEQQWSFVDWFVAKTMRFFEKMGRRNENRFARFNKEKVCIDGDLYKKFGKPISDRYRAVNFENEHTVEFRMCRTTSDWTVLMATLQLFDAVCRFAKTTGKSQNIIRTRNGKAGICTPSHLWDVFMSYVNEHKDRYGLLIAYERSIFPERT